MKNNKLVKAFIAISMLIAAVGPAWAVDVDFSNPAFAPAGGPTSIPIGHAEFCHTHRGECGPNARVVEAVELTQALWQQLLGVNAEVNATVVPRTDEELYRVAEYWTYPNGFGDCEDYALAKRRALIRDGWPASTLLVAVVRQADGEGHAVLMVRTDRGDLVLDNQDGNVRVWSDTPYHFVKRQSQSDQSQWVDILDARAITVALR